MGDFNSGRAEAEDALATPAAQAETRLLVAPRPSAAVVTVCEEDDTFVCAPPPMVWTPFFSIKSFFLAGVANTHGGGSKFRRMGTLSGLGTDGYDL